MLCHVATPCDEVGSDETCWGMATQQLEGTSGPTPGSDAILLPEYSVSVEVLPLMIT